jgi:hypothetical protein
MDRGGFYNYDWGERLAFDLPVTAVWQAATARGATTSLLGHLAVGTLAVLAAMAVATAAWRCGSTPRYAAVLAAALAAGYAVTGSALVPLLGALLVEIGAGAGATTTELVDTRGRSAPARTRRRCTAQDQDPSEAAHCW